MRNLLHRLFASTLLCAIMLAAGVNSVFATTLETTGSSTTSNLCGDERCCTTFTFNPTQNTDELTITLLTESIGASDACWDWTCFANNLPSGVSFTKITTGVFKLTFSPAVSSGPISFTLCPTIDGPSCSAIWSHFEWTAGYNSNPPHSNGDGPMYDCNSFSCQGLCDALSVYTTGGYQQFCLTRIQGTPATSVTLTFNPPIQACSTLVPSRSTWTPGFLPVGPGPYSSVTYTAPSTGPYLNPCQQFCVKVPICPPYQTTTVTMTASPSPNTCVSKSVTLKPITGGWQLTQPDGTVQNFPNPVTPESGLRTTIPFTVQADGEAVLKVYDASGHLELTSSQSVQKGENTFELSAADLMPGKYFYVVESPAGVAIVNQTMVVIK